MVFGKYFFLFEYSFLWGKSYDSKILNGCHEVPNWLKGAKKGSTHRFLDAAINFTNNIFYSSTPSMIRIKKDGKNK